MTPPAALECEEICYSTRSCNFLLLGFHSFSHLLDCAVWVWHCWNTTFLLLEDTPKAKPLCRLSKLITDIFVVMAFLIVSFFAKISSVSLTCFSPVISKLCFFVLLKEWNLAMYKVPWKILSVDVCKLCICNFSCGTAESFTKWGGKILARGEMCLLKLLEKTSNFLMLSLGSSVFFRVIADPLTLSLCASACKIIMWILHWQCNNLTSCSKSLSVCCLWVGHQFLILLVPLRQRRVKGQLAVFDSWVPGRSC